MVEAKTQKMPPLSKFKRTKMIITMGPAIDTYEEVLAVVQAGANAVRINCGYGDHTQWAVQIKHIRQTADALKKPVAIILDLQGPKLRLGDFEGVINTKSGQQLSFAHNAKFSETKIIPTQHDLSQKIKRGDRLLLKDGSITTTVTSVSGHIIHCRVENGGTIIKHQGFNVPDTDFDGEVLTEKDKQDISFGVSHNVEYIALSYVQSKKDILSLKNALKNVGHPAKIIAKIETQSAVDNLEEIVDEADALMVARGDLAIETKPESVPISQRRIIELSRQNAKPVIVATQLLSSMANSAEPSRAEVSDVASAVLMGADALALSDETAAGKDALKATAMLKRVITYTEQNTSDAQSANKTTDGRQMAIAGAIVDLAGSIGASAIIAETKSGATAQNISALRPNLPIIALSSSKTVASQLAIVYGVKSFVRADEEKSASKLVNWLHRKQLLNIGDIVVSCSGKHPGVVGSTDTIKVRVI